MYKFPTGGNTVFYINNKIDLYSERHTCKKLKSIIHSNTKLFRVNI